MEKNLIKILEGLLISAGLSEKEAKIYLILLQTSEAPAGKIISQSGLKKGNTYALLHQLKNKGLLTSFKKQRKAYFRAEPPAKILQLIEQKAIEVNQAKTSFAKLLPKLSSAYKLTVGRPTILYFEGKEGLREVFEDVYASGNKIIWGCLDLEKMGETFSSHILNDLIPKRIKNKVKAMALLAHSSQTKEVAKRDQKELRETVLLDKEEYPLPAEIEVYQDKVALLCFRKEDFVGLIIENKDFAESLRSIFKLAHSLGRKRNK